MSESILSLGEVEALAFSALTGAGASSQQAESLARSVAATERDGVRSHGLVYVPTYCEHLQCGKVLGQAVPRLEHPLPAALRVDAGAGFAHAAIDMGFARLVPLAREQGVAALSIHNSYNCGVLGYHVERLAEDGLVGMGFTNAPASIAPVGGSKPVIGTNPFALAVPDGQGGATFVIDQSASVVARSEVMMRARAKEDIPLGWAMDSDGHPTTDAEAAIKGSMAPAGGYKGFGMGLTVEIFAAALAGATLGKDASPFSGTQGGPPLTGQFFLAVNGDVLSGGLFGDRLDALVAAIAAQPGARLPGGRRKQARARTTRDGVSVDDALIARIKAFGQG